LDEKNLVGVFQIQFLWRTKMVDEEDGFPAVLSIFARTVSQIIFMAFLVLDIR
jgi:hypothetical protein